MRKQKVRIDFAHTKDNDLAENSQLIHDKLNGNPYFPFPPVTMADLQIAIDKFSTALIKSKDGTKKDTADKNAKRKILEDMLGEIGNYINFTANGDLVMLEGTGFPLAKVKAPVGILPQPKSFKVSDGFDPGAVKVEISFVEKAKGYIVLYYEAKTSGRIPANDSEWQSKLFSKTKGIITGLKSGSKYVFKTAATSARSNETNLYNFTETIERFVQ